MKELSESNRGLDNSARHWRTLCQSLFKMCTGGGQKTSQISLKNGKTG